ncbi:MAG TPA: hypothetical protein VI793_08485 [Anaerolineales bacterium]|nr:hypothetical protein [Anaerolineales bacterium]
MAGRESEAERTAAQGQTLREKPALILRQQVTARFDEILKPYGDRLLDDDGWLIALADECIRQMEWARRECTGEHWEGDGRDGTRHLVDRSEEPLILAPEGWKLR